jgi:hypothetical protein
VVVQGHGLRVSDFLAWLAWLFIHILYRVEQRNRIPALIQLAWSYVARNREARLVTGTSPLPLPIGISSGRATRER